MAFGHQCLRLGVVLFRSCLPEELRYLIAARLCGLQTREQRAQFCITLEHFTAQRVEPAALEPVVERSRIVANEFYVVHGLHHRWNLRVLAWPRATRKDNPSR